MSDISFLFINKVRWHLLKIELNKNNRTRKIQTNNNWNNIIEELDEHKHQITNLGVV